MLFVRLCRIVTQCFWWIAYWKQAEDTIVTIKNVTINEPFFNGHFPQYPVMPGVLIMEALAQTAGVLGLSKPENKGKLVFYAGMDKVKFKNKSFQEINW